METRGTQALCFYVLKLGSILGLQNIVKVTCEPVPAPDQEGLFLGKTRKVIRLGLSPQARREVGHEVDVLKVVITSRQASFAPLEMAPLNASSKGE